MSKKQGKGYLTRSGTLENLCAWVADGRSARRWAEEHRIPFWQVWCWLHKDAARLQRFRDAEAMGDQYRIRRVIEEIQDLATLNLRDAFKPDGSVKPINEIPAALTACISSIDVVEYFEGKGRNREQVGVIKKLRFHDKIRSLELLGKELKMFKDHLEHSGTVNLESLLEDVFEKGTPTPGIRAPQRN